MEFIDIIYYINLDHREDRNTHIKQVLHDLQVPDEKIHRISAVWNKQRGSIGCSESHIHAVKEFLQSGKNTCIILEDDFVYEHKDTFWSSIASVFQSNVEFDLIQLAYNHRRLVSDDTEYPCLKKVRDGQTTSGYILSKPFAPTLLNNFESGWKALQTSVSEHNEYDSTYTYTLDSYWKRLQPISKWFCFHPRLGYQIPSYSDVEQVFVDYKV